MINTIKKWPIPKNTIVEIDVNKKEVRARTQVYSNYILLFSFRPQYKQKAFILYST